MKEEGRHAPKHERRERGTSGQDLECTCLSSKYLEGSLKGDGKSRLLRHAQLPQRTRMLAQLAQKFSRVAAAFMVPA